MIGFIARYFSSIWELITAPFRLIWRGISRLFPPRDCTIMDTQDGNVHTYQQSSFWRFTKFCVTVTMTVWAAWSTYVYVYHRPLLQKRTQQLEQSRNQHNRQMADLKTYLQKYNDLTRELNVLDYKILKSEKLSDKEKENLLNTKSKITGELDFLHTRINEMMSDENYMPEFDKIAEMSVEFELVRSENDALKQQHLQIIQESSDIAAADTQIVEMVTKLTNDNIDDLHKNLKKINTSLTKLGLTETKLTEQANNYSNQIIGGKYTPITLNKNSNEKYVKIAKNIEKCHGLDRLTKILPIGAPVKQKTITSPYGMRKDPFTKAQKQHKGIDFAGKVGTELYAVAPGRVVSAGERSGYGTTVEIDHGLGFTTLYAHLSKIMVSRGDWVRPGTVI
ncbi:MAG: peptidoglycan DD-metalloendopeptidase family protein, partial [Alphaproteobacteria bacterium]|nr:peptidoglycan DD-metalloendopeptidase family protein [Alphaproteobacteria bacterium]